jgi:hypothetical protein
LRPARGAGSCVWHTLYLVYEAQSSYRLRVVQEMWRVAQLGWRICFAWRSRSGVWCQGSWRTCAWRNRSGSLKYINRGLQDQTKGSYFCWKLHYIHGSRKFEAPFPPLKRKLVVLPDSNHDFPLFHLFLVKFWYVYFEVGYLRWV